MSQETSPFRNLVQLRELPIVVRSDGEEFVSCFVEANLGASGETISVAIENLKDLIASVFMKYSSLPAAQLGPGPTKQLVVLKQFVSAATK